MNLYGFVGNEPVGRWDYLGWSGWGGDLPGHSPGWWWGRGGVGSPYPSPPTFDDWFRNLPPSYVDSEGITTVNACNIVIFFGHNGSGTKRGSNVPQWKIANHPCSRAGNVSCGPRFDVDYPWMPGPPQLPIHGSGPGFNPNPKGTKGYSLNRKRNLDENMAQILIMRMLRGAIVDAEDLCKRRDVAGVPGGRCCKVRLTIDVRLDWLESRNSVEPAADIDHFVYDCDKKTWTPKVPGSS